MDTYPDMVIELSSHTDAQGSDKYNERLSQRRAQSAVDWLIDRGVDPKRLVARGYGESVILNQCVNGVTCTDDEHRVNRRTEFKILAGPKEIQIKKEVFKGDGDTEKKN
jgi:outer membrane protein OmpA-like peptidoglycan-associated protein